MHATDDVTVTDEKKVGVDFELWNCKWLENAEAKSTLKVKLSHLPSYTASQLLKLWSV